MKNSVPQQMRLVQSIDMANHIPDNNGYTQIIAFLLLLGEKFLSGAAYQTLKERLKSISLFEELVEEKLEIFSTS